MQLTLKQWGNSCGIRFPKELMKQAGIKKNDTLKAEIIDGKIVLTPGFRHRSLEERAADYGCRLELTAEMDWGEPGGCGI